MGRKPCCEKVGLKRGPWTAEEDGKLVSYITNNGICCWRAIPKLAGLLRCGKSCRLRWTNYLRPDLKRGIFSEAEEILILDLHATLGNRWSRIAAQLPGRTDNEIKNYWNTRLKKRLRSQGLDPATHLPLKGGDDEDDDDDDGENSSDSGTNSVATNAKKKVPKIEEPGVKVRQPKGPKPQLKMCQSKEGQLVLLTSTSPTTVKSETELSDQSSNSGSTVTEAEGNEMIARNPLTTAPSFPEAELWKCIKQATPLAAPSDLLNEWDSYIMQCTAPANLNEEYVAESNNVDTVFDEMGVPEPWTMDTEIIIPPPAESLFANSNPALQPGFAVPEHLQRLATLLDLI